MEYIDDNFDKYYDNCPIQFYAIRYAKGNVYYFNQDNEYVWCPLEKCEAYGIKSGLYDWPVREPVLLLDQFAHSKAVLRKALATLKPLTTWNQFLDIWRKTKINPPVRGNARYSEFECGIGRVLPPEISRSKGNNKFNTFDFVRVYVPLIGSREQQRRFISKWRKQLDDLVIEHLKKSKNYTSYGVPVNFLKLVDARLYYDGIFEYLFELKEVSDEKC